MNSPLKYLQTQSGKTTSLAFEVLSCISLQAMIPSKPSVLPVAHCPLAEGLSSEKMKTSNDGYFPLISPSPRYLRCNLILLHYGDKSTPTFCFVSNQNIKASFEQSHLLEENATGEPGLSLLGVGERTVCCCLRH